ncbi:hypothetical protein [Williamsoniiplasma lucivorax]|uniref:Uncharacterized protein n=1 Tax=Williamsoniiplasma lucivorax TaxID=209274 RepID=A0A2S5RF61_9MOLU|nr:hypothetical protein [Williamsoniiplasma lucivorax]PPE05950.1 hypothetical protein ELUCI_v1c02410 [Williamsoniiplasma lucivorax]
MLLKNLLEKIYDQKTYLMVLNEDQEFFLNANPYSELKEFMNKKHDLKFLDYEVDLISTNIKNATDSVVIEIHIFKNVDSTQQN